MVPYNKIRHINLVSMQDMTLVSYKHWGMAFTPIWWPCDMMRHTRRNYILIDTGDWVKCAPPLARAASSAHTLRRQDWHHDGRRQHCSSLQSAPALCTASDTRSP